MKTSGKSQTAYDVALDDYLSGEQPDADAAWEKLAPALAEPASNLTARQKALLQGLRADELLLREDSHLLAVYKTDTLDPAQLRAMVRGWSNGKTRKRVSTLARAGLSFGAALACLVLVASLLFSLDGTDTNRESTPHPAVAPAVTPAAIFNPPSILYPVRGRNVLIAQFGDLVGGKISDGIDIAAVEGTPVIAVEEGTVVSAGWQDDHAGNAIVIAHNNGVIGDANAYYTRYIYLAKVEVAPGQTVTKGQEIGIIGTTGDSVGIHLHFEMIAGSPDGEKVNPLPYIFNFLAGIRQGQPTPTALP